MGPYTLIVGGFVLVILGNVWLYAQSQGWLAGSLAASATNLAHPGDSKELKLTEMIYQWKKEDTTYLEIDRRPEVFVPEWIAYLREMQATRNTYDFATLHRVSGRSLVGIKGPYKTQEIQ